MTSFVRALVRQQMMSRASRALLLTFSITGCAVLPPWYLRAPGSHPLPRYPRDLRTAGIEGEALLRLHVLPSGRLDHTRTRVLRASHAPFAAAALHAVRQWQTSPVRSDSVQVQVYFAVDRDERCSTQDSAARRDSPATLAALHNGLRIIISGWTCTPFKTVSDGARKGSASRVAR